MPFNELLNQILHLLRNSIFLTKAMIEFDKPIQTKSGLDIGKVWVELQGCWAEYEKAKLKHDHKAMRHHALRIPQLQSDIGLRQPQLPELADPPSGHN